ncbi:hypothetical protein [Microbulbifer aggregans]|uniref:hypothetical protein n=1 Tax=Microbulbifer aggregans TaxID=1769779 RepID=UPI001CFE8AB4|nr:hypothetical protein [Microbulbifer aggregans]
MDFTVGERIRMAAAMYGLDVTRIADECMASVTSVYKWYESSELPSDYALSKFCQMAHCSEDYILGRQCSADFYQLQVVTESELLLYTRRTYIPGIDDEYFMDFPVVKGAFLTDPLAKQVGNVSGAKFFILKIESVTNRAFVNCSELIIVQRGFCEFWGTFLGIVAMNGSISVGVVRRTYTKNYDILMNGHWQSIEASEYCILGRVVQLQGALVTNVLERMISNSRVTLQDQNFISAECDRFSH